MPNSNRSGGCLDRGETVGARRRYTSRTTYVRSEYRCLRNFLSGVHPAPFEKRPVQDFIIAN